MTILERIVARKRGEVAEARERVEAAELKRRVAGLAPPRDFRAALDVPGKVRIIAEVKKASPSAGLIRADFDPVAIATAYERAGAACVSVLTDADFQGHLDHLVAVRAAVSVPLLRKDFVIDPYQILEARAAGADCVLLIAEVLDDVELRSLLAEATGLGLAALVELHDRDNLRRVLDSGARLVGINNRDLRTFQTRIEHTLELAPLVPSDVLLVSESGIRSRADVERLAAAGVRAVLVGETLMRAPDISQALASLHHESYE